MNHNKITLLALQKRLKECIEDVFDENVWVVAEISQLQISQTGHCYFELVEKHHERIIAKMKATIWANTYSMLKPYFETSTGLTLQSGLKVLVKIAVNYNEIYGLHLDIKDIEPGFTRGEIELQRQKIYRQLQAEGIAEMNKELAIPNIPDTIAIISSPHAAGYEDFMDQLKNNPFGYVFAHKLFTATMQGKKAEQSILSALEKISVYESVFDLVVIVRGGGSQTELSSFDNYRLANHVARFPLPVICAIGHERDETVLDMVAAKSVKTPTAAAELLVRQFNLTDNHITNLKSHLGQLTTSYLQEKKRHLQELSLSFIPKTNHLLNKRKKEFLTHFSIFQQNVSLYYKSQKNELSTYLYILHKNIQEVLSSQKVYISSTHMRIKENMKSFVQYHRHRLQLCKQAITLNNPINVLKKGYSISFFDGKPIKDSTHLQEGAIIETQFSRGRKRSKILSKDEFT